MKILSEIEMDQLDSGSAVGCGVSVVVLMGTFVGLGAITAGVGWALIAIGSYAASLGGLVYECSDVKTVI